MSDIQQNGSEALVVATLNANSQTTHKPLKDSVKQALKNYLVNLEDNNIDYLYDLVLAEVEQPMLDIIMQYTRGNQTRAANMLGINRGTLRKKLKKYNMG